jgi:transcriptional regulator with XRE-family HTH domain
MTLTAEQIKEARRLLGWSQIRLAVRASISYSTLVRYETGHRTMGHETSAAIQRAIEAAGIHFNRKGPGVRLRKPK